MAEPPSAIDLASAAIDWAPMVVVSKATAVVTVCLNKDIDTSGPENSGIDSLLDVAYIVPPPPPPPAPVRCRNLTFLSVFRSVLR